MTARNGKVAAEVAEQVAAEVATPRRYRLDPDELTPKDMKRARVMLGGRSPWELMDDPDDSFTLIIWCLLSRTNAAFTWEQAENTPFGGFDPAVPKSPPPTEPLSSSGSNTERSDVSSSSSEPQSAEPARS